jgi:hypothetical protein
MSEMNLGAQILQNNLNNAIPNLPQGYRTSGESSSEYSKTFGQAGAFTNGPFQAYGSKGTTRLSGEAGIHFGDVDLQTQGDLGSAYLKGGMFAGARGRVFGDVDLENLSANAGFEAEVGARGHYEGGYSTPTNAPAGLDSGFNADAFAGARANGEAEVGLGNSPHAALGGEVFEGARAGVEGGAGLSVGGDRYVGARYGVEGWEGIGASASADIGIKDGKFHLDVSAGLALILGGKVSWGFDVNLGAISKLPGKLLNTLGGAAKDVAKTIGKGLASGANIIGDAFKNVGKTVSNVFNTATKGILT